MVAGLLLLGGIVAALTVDGDGSTALPDQLLGEDEVTSDTLGAAAALVSEPLEQTGLTDVTARFYGSSADNPAVFAARGLVPEDAENPRTVMDQVNQALSGVYMTGVPSGARDPGGDGITCAATTLPAPAGRSTVCSVLLDDSLAVFTLFGRAASDPATTDTVREVRDQLADAG